VADSPTSFRVEVLTENEGPRLRDIRLAALQEYPSAFMSSYEREAAYSQRRWAEEVVRGEWHIMLVDDKEVGLVGVTREDGMSAQQCYLEALWIAPGSRRSGVGSVFLRTVLERLRDNGVHTVWLYILDGNDGAMRFYRRFGFQSTYERHPLPGHPAGNEELVRLRMADLKFPGR
jgi:ribosomal protein S18 acetylase RimI-like enzyme